MRRKKQCKSISIALNPFLHQLLLISNSGKCSTQLIHVKILITSGSNPQTTPFSSDGVTHLTPSFLLSQPPKSPKS